MENNNIKRTRKTKAAITKIPVHMICNLAISNILHTPKTNPTDKKRRKGESNSRITSTGKPCSVDILFFRDYERICIPVINPFKY